MKKYFSQDVLPLGMVAILVIWAWISLFSVLLAALF